MSGDIGADGKGVINQSGSLQVGGCCCEFCVEQTLPDPTDTVLVTFRGSGFCAGCHENTSDLPTTYYRVLALNIDGTYSLAHLGDSSGTRSFIVHDQAVIDSHLKTPYSTSDCSGTANDLTNGVLSIRVDFSIATGCIQLIWADLNESFDGGRFFPYVRRASMKLDEFYPCLIACGDKDIGLNADIIGDAIEAQVSIV